MNDNLYYALRCSIDTDGMDYAINSDYVIDLADEELDDLIKLYKRSRKNIKKYLDEKADEYDE